MNRALGMCRTVSGGSLYALWAFEKEKGLGEDWREERGKGSEIIQRNYDQKFPI